MKRIDVEQAQRLMRRGALVVDVLPAHTYAEVHLPGAVSIPLSTLDEDAVADIDRDRALVVYCFDQRCDLSARASSRFDQLGFTSVHDLIGGRAAWTVLGLPTEGHLADRRRVRRHLRPASSAPIDSSIGDVHELDSNGGPIAVVDRDGVLLGALDDMARCLPAETPVERAMTLAPGTIRPDVLVDDAVQQLTDDGLDVTFVSTAQGQLLGLFFRDQHV
jgi:rhodanese-related sulfurtransferase